MKVMLVIINALKFIQAIENEINGFVVHVCVNGPGSLDPCFYLK